MNVKIASFACLIGATGQLMVDRQEGTIPNEHQERPQTQGDTGLPKPSWLSMRTVGKRLDCLFEFIQ